MAKERVACNWLAIESTLRSLLVANASAEIAFHNCYTHDIKGACDSIVPLRKDVDKLSKEFIGLLKECEVV